MRNKFIVALLAILMVSINVYAYNTVQLSENISELRALMGECTNLGLECPYEEMKITVMEQFVNDEEISEPEIAEFRLNDIYTETKNALNSYISGENVPMNAPKYQTSEVEIKGRSMFANTTEGKRPFFFVGYGHFAEAVEAFEDFSKMGANITQQEIGPWNVIYEAAMPYGWERYCNGYDKNAIEACFESENVRGGEVSLKIDLTSNEVDSGYAVISQQLELEPDTMYTLSFSAKASGDSNNIYVIPFTEMEKIYLTASSVWKNYRISFKTAQVISGKITIGAGKNAVGYIDNIVLEKNGSSKNLINNGNFEKNADRFGNNNEYMVSVDYIENKVVPMLERAEVNNVLVSLLISPHYFPAFVKEYYPDINIYHEQYEIIMNKYIETLIPFVQKKSALNDICISNEPISNSSEIVALTADYRDYLAEKYTSLNGINAAFGTSYTSWEEITMPNEVVQTREFYDWMEYNDTKYAEWHKNIAENIKRYMPDAKIHSKMQDYLAQDGTLDFERGRLMWGTDAEKFAKFSDLAGNDSYSTFEWRVGYSDGRPITGKLKWYDFISSIYEKPVFNSEDHIIADKSQNYDERVAAHVYADLFQGAIHGRSASALWTWRRSDDEESVYQGNIMQRPDVMVSVGKAALDLNRLSYEVSAFADKQADVTIYYSNLERVYNPKHITAMDRVYDACLYAGQKTEFVTDNSIEKISDCDVLIIPYVTHISDGTLKTIELFKDSGKPVILIGSCFLYDEYGKNIEFDADRYILFNSWDENTILDLAEVIYSSVNNDYSIKLCNADGELISGVEWNYVLHNGRFFINVCNYNDNSVENLKILFENEIMNTQEAISSKSIESFFAAKPFEPLLLTFEAEKFMEISHCSIIDGATYVTVKNVAGYTSEIRIIAEYYDENDVKRKWGGVKKIINSGERVKAIFGFGKSKGRIVVRLVDGWGITLAEKTVYI